MTVLFVVRWRLNGHFKYKLSCNMQLIVASLNEKSSEESSSDEDSANKSDEEVIEGLAGSEIRESERDDVQKSVDEGV